MYQVWKTNWKLDFGALRKVSKNSFFGWLEMGLGNFQQQQIFWLGWPGGLKKKGELISRLGPIGLDLENSPKEFGVQNWQRFNSFLPKFFSQRQARIGLGSLNFPKQGQAGKGIAGGLERRGQRL